MSRKTKDFLEWAIPLWILALLIGFLAGFFAYGLNWRHGVAWACYAFVIVFLPTMISYATQR